jgi:hypothetical protein
LAATAATTVLDLINSRYRLGRPNESAAQMCLGPFFGHGELSAALISTSFIDPHALDRDRAPGCEDVTPERLVFDSNWLEIHDGDQKVLWR